MTEAKGRAPPQQRDAAEAGTTATAPACGEELSTLDRHRLFEMATAISPKGDLRRHVPTWPLWCRRIGDDVTYSLIVKDRPDPSEMRLLLDAHARATARRDHDREVDEKERKLRALSRRAMRGEHIPPNAVAEIMGPLK